MSEWQPIETAPLNTAIMVWRDGVIGVAVFTRNHGWLDHDASFLSSSHAWIGQRIGSERPSAWMGGEDATTASHWMPLPAKPLTSNKEGTHD